MKHLWALTLLFPIFFSPKDIIKHTLRSTVFVEWQADAHGVCTGFVVRPYQIVTAAHCVPEDAVVGVDGLGVKVRARDDNFALLDVEGLNKPPLKLADHADMGEGVYAFGYGWGVMTVLHRTIGGVIEGDVMLDGPLAPGMSGGPVVNEDGKVVGVNQKSNEVVGILCGVEELKAFLK